MLDGFGNCVRNGSWEALGGPKCSFEIAELEVAPTVIVASEEAAAKAVPVLKPAVVAEISTESSMASEPEPAVVNYSYPVELITTNVYFDFDKNNLRVS